MPELQTLKAAYKHCLLAVNIGVCEKGVDEIYYRPLLFHLYLDE